jgi:hypothetical protein
MRKSPPVRVVDQKVYQQTNWGGTSRSDRAGFLTNQNLGVKQQAHEGRSRSGHLPNIMIGLTAFLAVVIGAAVVWPSYLSCRHLQQTTGLINGQTMTACSLQTVLWRLTP